MDRSTVLVVGGPGLTIVVREALGRSARVMSLLPTVAAAADVSPIVVLIDVDGPRGLGLLAETGRLFPSVPRLAVAADDGPAALDVLGFGATGLLSSAARGDEVRDAIVRAVAGEPVIPDRFLADVVLQLRERRADQAGDPMGSLTSRELEVLRMVAGGASTAEVARGLGISTATVQSHVKNVLAKLGVHSKVEAVRMAWRRGVATIPAGA
jgi:two-component system nitrate/nitrite response regulator NarL